MRVKDLLAFLRTADPEADVCLVAQPHYPMRYGIAGACQRGDCDDTLANDDAQRRDVLLVEGSHLGYYAGRSAWDAARR